jgi:mannose-1-phosphate guanylyltransferase
MIYGVILAGGKGERFWPYSTVASPKQLLPVISDRPMIVETIERIATFIPRDKIIIVTGKELTKPIKKILPQIKLLSEPFGRNTACAIAYASIKMKPNDIMVVLPADHYIPDKDLFLQTLKRAIKVAEKGYLTTFGIVPTRAETGYGYIELGDELSNEVYKVNSFTEKPNQKEAYRFLREGRFLWNSGMFVWRQDVILSEFKAHMPELYDNLEKYMLNQIPLIKLYEEAPNISIDYGVLEKSQNVAVVKSQFLWDDIGEWTALERIYEPDSNGNIKKGAFKGRRTKNCLIMCDKGIIATIGVSNLIIVRNGNKVFVCDKRKVGEIKKLLYQISQDKSLKKYL